MSGALIIPGADRTSRWFAGPDDYPDQFVMPRIDKTLLHSTETRKAGACPWYGGGAVAPQVTINPWPGFQRIWQHFPLNRAGRALGNPSSTPVSENKDNVEQWEIIGFSDPALGREHGCYLPDLPDEGLDFLARALAFVHREWPHPTTLPPTWPLYKVSSWTAMDAAHMTSDEYDQHRGWLAHLHAPKPSTHGDVALNVRVLKAKVDALLAPPPPPQEVPVGTVPNYVGTAPAVDVVKALMRSDVFPNLNRATNPDDPYVTGYQWLQQVNAALNALRADAVDPPTPAATP